MQFSALPYYVLWGPVLQDAILDFIKKAGWEPTTPGFWSHSSHEDAGEVSYLKAFEITRDHLYAPAEQ